MSLDFDLDRMRLMERTHYLWDDFTDGGISASGPIGETGWTVSAVGTPTISISSLTGRIGIRRFQTGAKSGDLIVVHRAQFFDIDLAGWDMRVAIRTINTSSNVVFRVGFFNNVTSNPTMGAYFEKDTAETTWFAVIENGANIQRTNTGIGIDDAFHRFGLVKLSDGTWKFFAEDVEEASHASQVSSPTGLLSPAFFVSTAENNLRYMDVDYCNILNADVPIR